MVLASIPDTGLLWVNLQAASLLDLPDLALVKIAKHLSPPDLASCMQTCSRLNSLFRPQMSAIVSARHLGRKWVLRACGRALFRAVTQLFESGKLNVFSEDPDDSILIGEAQQEDLEMQRILAKKLEQGWEVVTRIWLSWKAQRGDRPDDCSAFMEDIVFLCNLAESKGFNAAVVHLESTVCKQFFLEGGRCLEVFLAKRALSISDEIYEEILFNEGEEFPLDQIGIDLVAAIWLLRLLMSYDARIPRDVLGRIKALDKILMR